MKEPLAHRMNGWTYGAVERLMAQPLAFMTFSERQFPYS